MEHGLAPTFAKSLVANVLNCTFGPETAGTTERLPFTIKPVRTDEEMQKAVRVRHAAYARHVPEFARSLVRPEPADYAGDTIVLLAESKLDGSALGSTRIRTNLLRPLDLEQSVELPGWLQGRRLVEATRLGVHEGRQARLVKMALIKACFMYCEENAIEWSVATARQAVDRQYEQLTFVDVFPGAGPVPLRHVGNLPHRVMAFDVATFEARWRKECHPMLGFFFDIDHPDISIGSPAVRRPVAEPELRSAARKTFAQRELALA